MASKRLFVLAFVVAVVAGVLFRAEASDVIQVHSLFPPILKNYWANGMQFWAFGRHTVVTDAYVQLTTLDPESEGYLWNRHSNRMDAFELNVTLQMRSRDGGWFAPGGDSGFGVWYTSDPKVNYKTDDTFFGFRQDFRGVGVVLDHSNELHLIESDGSFSLNPTTMKTHQKGSCSISALGELHATVSLLYKDNKLQLFYVLHLDKEPAPSDYENSIFCASINHLSLTSSYHFGVTAANSANGQAAHSVHSVVMTPLSNVAQHAQEEAMVGQPRLFETTEDDGAASHTPTSTSSTTTTTESPSTAKVGGLAKMDDFEVVETSTPQATQGEGHVQRVRATLGDVGGDEY